MTGTQDSNKPSKLDRPAVENTEGGASEQVVIDLVQSAEHEPWTPLARLLERGDAEALLTFFRLIEPSDVVYSIGRLDDVARTRVFDLIASEDPEIAADLLEHFSDEHAADIIEDLTPARAAAIVHELDSADQADVMQEVQEEEAAAILQAMDPTEAADLALRLAYEEDSAGGLMIQEVITVQDGLTIGEAIDDLRERADTVDEDDFEVRYLYVVDHGRRLIGVLAMRHIVMARPDRRVSDLMIRDLTVVSPEVEIDDLEHRFDRVGFSAIPVVNAQGVLLGVVQRFAVQEARAEFGDEALAKSGGIIGGEEIRSMPLRDRTLRRLMFLTPILFLLMASAVVIAMFESTVERVPILAAFLPLVAGLCGSAGGQAVAVSMRELALGLIKPGDFFYVFKKEAAVAIINGVLLGFLLALVTWAWQGNPYLGLVIGGSIPLVMLIATTVGGTVPVLLKSRDIDPAMLSGPLVTTVVDLTGFFTVLIFAFWLAEKLV